MAVIETITAQLRANARSGLAAAAAGVFLFGCATGGRDIHEHHHVRGVVPAADEFSLEAAERLCSISSLTEVRDTMRTEVRDAEMLARRAWGPSETRNSNVRIEDRTGVPERPAGYPTERLELVRAFESDLDASYRFATTSCQSYAMCMHQRGYQEESCRDSRLQWADARRDFHRLSERLADVRLAVTETACHDCSPRPHDSGPDPYYPEPHHGGGHYAPPHDYAPHAAPRRHHDRHGSHGRRSQQCSSVLGDVFTTGPCRDY